MNATWLLLLAGVLPGEDDSTSEAGGVNRHHEVVASVDFRHDIVPILTKAGCNTGACHGAAIGRGGFKLSLFGDDPSVDYYSMVLQRKGRRVNLHDPQQSLVLLKPSESLSHGGGQRLRPNSLAMNRLTDWIRGGASFRSTGSDVPVPSLTRLQVNPQSIVQTVASDPLKLQAIARYSDGSSRDVTRWTVFTPDDPSAVQVDEVTAEASVRRRGRHVVIARYMSEVEPIEIIRPMSDNIDESVSHGSVSGIDQYIEAKLSQLGIPVSAQADDVSFLRRVCLDLTGRLPTPSQFVEFQTGQSDTRRQDWVEQLLASEEFVEFWTYRFAQLLRMQPIAKDQGGLAAYHGWLRYQISGDVGYDQIVTQLLGARGNTQQIGAANFFRTAPGPREQAEFVSELLMGARLRCANCHNHPLDMWTQDDYHGLAAIFAKVRLGKLVTVQPDGKVVHPKTGEPARPRLPGDRFLDAQDDGLVSFSKWMTDPENPYFAKAIVNRLWGFMMGRGLVDPVDDIRATNPATHPALLDYLTSNFRDNGFRIRSALREIVLSKAYSRSHALNGNRSDDRFYSHAVTRPLDAAILADAISDVLDAPEIYPGAPVGTRAVSLVDATVASRSLDVLGRCERSESCEVPGANGQVAGLPLQLHLINGPLINGRIMAESGRLARNIDAAKDPIDIVTDFYIAALSRRPTVDESEFWNDQFSESMTATEEDKRLQDFVWAILTCDEFTTNH